MEPEPLEAEGNQNQNTVAGAASSAVAKPDDPVERLRKLWQALLTLNIFQQA